MALWGNNDNRTATGRVSLDKATGIVTGANLEDVGNGTKFGETGEVQVGDIIRFGVIDKPGTYFGDAVVVSIAGTTQLTIGSTMGLENAAIARTSFTATQAPKSTVLDSSFSENDNINDGAPTIKNLIKLQAHSGVSTTGVGASIVDLKTHHRSSGGIKVGDFLENQGNNIKIISVGTATFSANFPSGIGSDRIFINGTVPGLDLDTAIFVDSALHFPTSIGATFFVIVEFILIVLLKAQIDILPQHYLTLGVFSLLFEHLFTLPQLLLFIFRHQLPVPFGAPPRLVAIDAMPLILTASEHALASWLLGGHAFLPCEPSLASVFAHAPVLPGLLAQGGGPSYDHLSRSS